MWGFISAISLVIGSVIGTWRLPRQSIRAVLMSFGGGALLFALSVELFAHRLHQSHGDGEHDSSNVVWVMEAAAVLGGLLYEGLNKALSSGGGEFRNSVTLRRKFHELRAMSLKRLVKRLSKLPLLSSLTTDELRYLVQHNMHHERFHKSDVIFHRDSPEKAIYFILSGCVEVLLFEEDENAVCPPSPKKPEGAESLTLSCREKVVDRMVLGRDQLFGDVAVLTGSDVRTEAKALGPVRSLVMPAREFRRLIDRKPDIRKHLLMRAVERLEKTNILSGLPLKSLIQLSTNAVPVTYEAGQTLIEGHVDGNSPLYIILMGTVDVEREDDGDRELVRSNQVVGSEHLMYARSRPVTAVAAEQVTALQISRHDLDLAVGECEGGLPWLKQKAEDKKKLELECSALPYTTPPASEYSVSLDGTHTPTLETMSFNDDCITSVINGVNADGKIHSKSLSKFCSNHSDGRSASKRSRSGSKVPCSPCVNMDVVIEPLDVLPNSVNAFNDRVNDSTTASSRVSGLSLFGASKERISKDRIGPAESPEIPCSPANRCSKTEGRKQSKAMLGWTEEPVAREDVDLDRVEPFTQEDQQEDLVRTPSKMDETTIEKVNSMERPSIDSPEDIRLSATLNPSASMEELKPTSTMATMDGAGHGGKHAAIMIWLGILIDGVPEAFVIGMMVTASNGQVKAVLPFVIGVFLSNLPESMSSSGTMKAHGMKTPIILAMWWTITLTTAVGAGLGASLFPPDASENPDLVMTIAAVEGVAAGAMLTMIAQTMMPEAFEQGGDIVGLSCLLGFLTALTVKLLPIGD
jgi:CRP-like cAMP-binding protein